MKKVVTTVKMPRPLMQEMLEKVINDRYGMRGKSKWIIEAIISFLKLPDYEELVNIADDIEDVSEVVSLRLPVDVMVELENAVITVRKIYPAMEGVKSNIIRGSIIQRLLRT